MPARAVETGDRDTGAPDASHPSLVSPAAPPEGVTAGGAALGSPRAGAALPNRLTPARRRWDVRPGLGGLSLLVVLAAAAGASLSAGAHEGGVTFSGRIAAGCDELSECRSLEAEAERRAAECVLLCGRAEAEHRAARLLRYRAEERLAVRDHYRARERDEQLERERARARARDERERREAARAEELAREHRERLELAAVQQAAIERRLAEERQRRIGYHVALGPEGRARRLTRCLERQERCDALTLELLEAARDAEERRALAERNERWEPPPPAAGAPAPGELPVSEAAPRAARVPSS